jgi:hypothetical protein
MKDSRGPFRKVLKIESAWDTGKPWTLVYFECNHIGELNPIYKYNIGEELRCFKCKEE